MCVCVVGASQSFPPNHFTFSCFLCHEISQSRSPRSLPWDWDNHGLSSLTKNIILISSSTFFTFGVIIKKEDVLTSSKKKEKENWDKDDDVVEWKDCKNEMSNYVTLLTFMHTSSACRARECVREGKICSNCFTLSDIPSTLSSYILSSCRVGFFLK
jgi:hypothetical protein